MASAEGLYETNVMHAVGRSLSEKKPLVVALVKEEEPDNVLVNLMKAEAVSTMMRRSLVPLKLIQGSEDYTNFIQIFPVKDVPCVCVVQENKILDTIVNVDISEDELVQRLKQHVPTVAHTPHGEQKHASSSSQGKQKNQQTDGNQQEQQKTAKAKEQYQQELQKHKQAEEDERQRVLRLVEKDREERRRAKAAASASETAPSKPQHQHQHQQHKNPNECALAIRLFDGKAIKHVFQSNESLADVRSWLDANRTDGNQAYSFCQSFPRRLFGESEEYESLRTLELTPSATLMLKPASHSTSAYSDAATGGLTSWFGAGSQMVSNALNTFLGIGYEPVPVAGQDGRNADENTTTTEPPSTSSAPQSQTNQDGNIRTFRRGSNDNRTTYNGNQLSLEDDNKKNDKKND